MKIAVLGNGAWGTALAVHVARRGHEATLWAHDPADVAAMRADRMNHRYLAGVAFPANLVATGDREEAVSGAGLVLAVIPSEFFRSTVKGFSPVMSSGVPVVSATKGIEHGTLRRMTEVLTEVLPGHPAVALSGPTFAAEVSRGEPTVAVVASTDAVAARLAQSEISDGRFRLYTSDDPVGVELGGALKNVIAIAAGIVTGMGFGYNTTAALITRGLAELSRLGTALGGRPETFAGLAGMGDLVLTCTGALSRNRHVGQKLGEGMKLDEVLASMGHVAEGVRTTSAALDLAKRAGVEVPICEQVGRILRAEIGPDEAIRELMGRELKRERA